jgi:hypothetical protein
MSFSVSIGRHLKVGYLKKKSAVVQNMILNNTVFTATFKIVVISMLASLKSKINALLWSFYQMKSKKESLAIPVTGCGVL